MERKKLNKLYLVVTMLFVLGVTLACGSSVRTTPAQTPSGGSQTVEVVAEDVSFSISATQAEPGTVTFVVRNQGEIQHDFAINGNGVEAKTEMLNPGESENLIVELEPGVYEYVCTVPGHAMLGMRGDFTVAQ